MQLCESDAPRSGRPTNRFYGRIQRDERLSKIAGVRRYAAFAGAEHGMLAVYALEAAQRQILPLMYSRMSRGLPALP
jgi:hypothetical protein